MTHAIKDGKLWRCPECNMSHYKVGHSKRTLAYYPPVIKDGINTNPDRNISTTHCTCKECGCEFTIKS